MIGALALDTEPLTRRVLAAGSADATTGVYVPGSATDTAFVGHVDPAPADVLESLPEGDRNRDVIEVITETALAVGQQVVRDATGVVYEVRRVGLLGLINHYEAVCVALSEGSP